MTLTIDGVVGNPRQGSKTLAATTAFVELLATRIGADSTHVHDLAAFGSRVLDYADPAAAALRSTLTGAQVLVVATPVYKGSYTGLLKAFLDGYGPGALADTLTIPFTVAASPEHSLAGATHLQPLLDELGAISPMGGLFLRDSVVAEPEERDIHLAAWIDSRLPRLARLTGVAA
ncbi:FMN reductase [Conyzicola lurida]|uniref:FMN reductase n=1 Tax=Conyzicola lurida TaxID=1172621 RepID=A0A841AP16_9MICO|nr:FMN reductase [Conyzicola lurida]